MKKSTKKVGASRVLAKSSVKEPRKIALSELVDSGLRCPHCRKGEAHMSLTCTAGCRDAFKATIKAMEKEFERINLRFAAFWVSSAGANLVVLPNARSACAFLVSGTKLTDCLEKLAALPEGVRTEEMERFFAKLAQKREVECVEKDLFIPLMPGYRAFLDATKVSLREIEEFLPSVGSFMSELKPFSVRLGRMAAKAFHPDKNKGKTHLVHHLDSKFWENLIKEPGLGGKIAPETLMAYPGLDFEEASPVTWRFIKFVGVVPPDAKALKAVAKK